MPALYGTKVGMTRIYEGESIVPVTLVEVLPNEVVEVKTDEKHGYKALKVACGARKKRIDNKPLAGEFKKADVAPRAFLREVPFLEGVGVGGKLTVELFKAGSMVDVTATTKGRGFAGVMKRHNFGGHKATHGTQVHRGPGSIGCRMDPGKVWKGKRMAGHYGNDQVTIKNLAVVRVDTERHLLVIKGSIPGPNGGLVSIKQA